jgi:hypothetical protein
MISPETKQQTERKEKMKEITVKAYEFDELSDSAKETARQWFREGSYGDDFWSECTLEEAEEQAAHLGIEISRINWTNRHGFNGSDPCIYWSGFSSQGDGACFEGSWSASRVQADKVADGWGDDPATTEIKRIAKEFERIAKAYPDACFSVKHSGHYYHKYCTEFDITLMDDEEYDKKSEEAADALSKAIGEIPSNLSAEAFSRFVSRKKEELWGDYLKEESALKEVARDFMEWIYQQLEKEYDYFMSDDSVDETIRVNEYLFTEEGKRRVVL